MNVFIAFNTYKNKNYFQEGGVYMEDAAREARNRYKREWYARNKDKQREYENRYWMRIAISNNDSQKENGDMTNNLSFKK